MATTVPLVSSGTAGPLGALHLPRLWAKMTLYTADALAPGYDFCGAGFDQMTIGALNVDRDKMIAYFKEKHPTYTQFEKWVLEQNGGSISPETIAKHNAAIAGYKHSDELASQMRSASGVDHEHIKDAVTLNTLEDLDDFHSRVAVPAKG